MMNGRSSSIVSMSEENLITSKDAGKAPRPMVCYYHALLSRDEYHIIIVLGGLKRDLSKRGLGKRNTSADSALDSAPDQDGAGEPLVLQST